MYKIIQSIAYSLLLSFLFYSCTDSSKKRELEPWLGNYEYGVKVLYDFNENYRSDHWHLAIHRINENYQSILNVKDSLGAYSATCDVKGDSNLIYIIFDSMNTEYQELYKKGDTLFSMMINDEKIRTTWRKINPPGYLDLTPCICFKYIGKNKDGNILTIK